MTDIQMINFDPTAIDLDFDNTAFSFPVFDVGQMLASNLYEVSSALPETSTEDATAAVEKIERQRNTLQVIQANLGYNSDVVRTGTMYQKFVGDTIDHATTIVGNRTKQVNYNTSLVNLDIANLKFQTADEKRLQAAIDLQGTRELTPLLQERWTLRKRKLGADISKIRVDVEQAIAELQNLSNPTPLPQEN
jgi:hypothetical protein